MRTVDKGIALTTWIVTANIRKTRVARCGVGRDSRFSAAALTLSDFERCWWVVKHMVFNLDCINARQWRCAVGNRYNKLIECISGHKNQNAFRVIQHRTTQTEVLRELPNIGPKPNALHLPTHTNTQSLGQWTVHTIQGSKLRTICWTVSGVSSASPTSAPTSAVSTGPGVPEPSRGLKFQVVGAII